MQAVAEIGDIITVRITKAGHQQPVTLNRRIDIAGQDVRSQTV